MKSYLSCFEHISCMCKLYGQMQMQKLNVCILCIWPIRQHVNSHTLFCISLAYHTHDCSSWSSWTSKWKCIWQHADFKMHPSICHSLCLSACLSVWLFCVCLSVCLFSFKLANFCCRFLLLPTWFNLKHLVCLVWKVKGRLKKAHLNNWR